MPGAFTEFIITLRRDSGGSSTDWSYKLSVYILVVDDEPMSKPCSVSSSGATCAPALTMEFAPSAAAALVRAANVADPS